MTIASVQKDDYKTNCLLDYQYFKENCQLLAIDHSKQQAINTNLKAIQQISLTGNLEHAENTPMFFINERGERNYSWFVFKNSRSIVSVFCKFVLYLLLSLTLAHKNQKNTH